MGQSSRCKEAFWQFIFSVNHLAFVVALVLQNIYKVAHLYFFIREKREFQVNEERW